MQRKKIKPYLKEFWEAFEKTGSIGAYLLYNDMRKRIRKSGNVRIKK